MRVYVLCVLMVGELDLRRRLERDGVNGIRIIGELHSTYGSLFAAVAVPLQTVSRWCKHCLSARMPNKYSMI